MAVGVGDVNLTIVTHHRRRILSIMEIITFRGMQQDSECVASSFSFHTPSHDVSSYVHPSTEDLLGSAVSVSLVPAAEPPIRDFGLPPPPTATQSLPGSIPRAPTHPQAATPAPTVTPAPKPPAPAPAPKPAAPLAAKPKAAVAAAKVRSASETHGPAP